MTYGPIRGRSRPRGGDPGGQFRRARRRVRHLWRRAVLVLPVDAARPLECRGRGSGHVRRARAPRRAATRPVPAAAVALRRRTLAMPAPDSFVPSRRAARGVGRDDERRDARLRLGPAQRALAGARLAGNGRPEHRRTRGPRTVATTRTRWRRPGSRARRDPQQREQAARARTGRTRAQPGRAARRARPVPMQ